nr:MAG TPA: hypothetical protein [Caudoviricetes sp.]
MRKKKRWRKPIDSRWGLRYEEKVRCWNTGLNSKPRKGENR